MNNELVERVARIIDPTAFTGTWRDETANGNAKGVEAFNKARLVLAELAGELRDAERLNYIFMALSETNFEANRNYKSRIWQVWVDGEWAGQGKTFRTALDKAMAAFPKGEAVNVDEARHG